MTTTTPALTGSCPGGFAWCGEHDWCDHSSAAYVVAATADAEAALVDPCDGATFPVVTAQLCAQDPRVGVGDEGREPYVLLGLHAPDDADGFEVQLRPGEVRDLVRQLSRLLDLASAPVVRPQSRSEV